MTALMVHRDLPELRPACLGESALFDSTLPADHVVARASCSVCPVIDWCRSELDAVLNDSILYSQGRLHAGPSGTWAGVLFDWRSKPVQVRVKPCRRCGRDMLPKGNKGNRAVAIHAWAGCCQDCLTTSKRKPRKRYRSQWAGKPCVGGCGRTLAVHDRSPEGLREKLPEGSARHHGHGLCVRCYDRRRRRARKESA